MCLDHTNTSLFLKSLSQSHYCYGKSIPCRVVSKLDTNFSGPQTKSYGCAGNTHIPKQSSHPRDHPCSKSLTLPGCEQQTEEIYHQQERHFEQNHEFQLTVYVKLSNSINSSGTFTHNKIINC